MYRKILHRFKGAASLLSKQRRQLVDRVAALDIDEANGTCGAPYIRLKDGTIFYGFPPSLSQRVQYYIWGRRFKTRIPVHTYGVACDIVIRYLSHGLKYGGPDKEQYYSPRMGDTVAEMGAYLGFYVIRLSRAVGSEGRVIAIEPMPENVEILRRNVKENNLNNVTIMPYGVWRENGSMNIISTEAGGQANSLIDTGDSVKSISNIEVRTLDTIFTDANITRVDFMVIQLNGNEFDALCGLNNTATGNFAIAARYKRVKDVYPSELIAEHLSRRGYVVKTEAGEYVFASVAK